MTTLQCNYARILLMEAHGARSSMDVEALVSVLEACISGDIDALDVLSRDSRQHVRSSAQFILKKHAYAAAQGVSLRDMKKLAHESCVKNTAKH